MNRDPGWVWRTSPVTRRDWPSKAVACTTCHGTGHEIKILGQDPMTGATFRQVGGPCPHCEGRGYMKEPA